MCVCSYAGVSLHTQDLLQQRGEGAERRHGGSEAQQQHHVGSVLQQLREEADDRKCDTNLPGDEDQQRLMRRKQSRRREANTEVEIKP